MLCWFGHNQAKSSFLIFAYFAIKIGGHHACLVTTGDQMKCTFYYTFSLYRQMMRTCVIMIEYCNRGYDRPTSPLNVLFLYLHLRRFQSLWSQYHIRNYANFKTYLPVVCRFFIRDTSNTPATHRSYLFCTGNRLYNFKSI